MAGSPRERLRTVVVTTVLAFGALGVGQLVVGASGLLLASLGVPVFERTALQLGLGVVMLQGVTFGGVALAYLALSGLTLEFVRVRFPTPADLEWALGGYLALIASLLVISAALSYFDVPSAQNRIEALGRETPAVFLLLILLSFLIVGPGEELLYRGLVQGLLRDAFGPNTAIVLASALFAVVHVFALRGPGKFVYVGVVFVLALILGAAYERTRNLVVPALVHGAYNATLFGVAYLRTTGRL